MKVGEKARRATLLGLTGKVGMLRRRAARHQADTAMTCRAAAFWPTREEIERIRADYDIYCATPDLTGAVQIASRLGIVLRRVEWLEMLLRRGAPRDPQSPSSVVKELDR
ncbi:MAG TPA: hypothetical protein DCQ64_32585 [Candidatus Rokubacteria bacterium]|nr:hypothetical protein [Candidatus Rokubacteria bacterium]